MAEIGEMFSGQAHRRDRGCLPERPRALRWRRAAACGLMLLALPLGTLAAGPRYRPVRNWPARYGKQPPQYGYAPVSGVATDRKGRVYVFQREEPPLVVFDRRGRFLRAWGRGMFSAPHGCRVDPQGNVWLTDVDDHFVAKFSPEGRLLMVLGQRKRSGEDRRSFNGPADVAFGRNGEIYVADGYFNARVVRFSRAGRYLGEWGGWGDEPGEFDLPHSIATDRKGRVYVADRENRRIQVFTPRGRLLRLWQTPDRPFGLSVGPDQKLYVVDGTGNTISIYTLQGRLLARWGSRGMQAGKMATPHMLCVDDRRAIYVAELDGMRVQKFVRR